jgi:hypothetical protein
MTEFASFLTDSSHDSAIFSPDAFLPKPAASVLPPRSRSWSPGQKQRIFFHFNLRKKRKKLCLFACFSEKSVIGADTPNYIIAPLFRFVNQVDK